MSNLCISHMFLQAQICFQVIVWHQSNTLSRTSEFEGVSLSLAFLPSIEKFDLPNLSGPARQFSSSASLSYSQLQIFLHSSLDTLSTNVHISSIFYIQNHNRVCDHVHLFPFVDHDHKLIPLEHWPCAKRSTEFCVIFLFSCFSA